MSKDDDETDKASEERRVKLRNAGMAVGIGSAAVVAALLYASNVKKKTKKPGKSDRPATGDATD